MGHLVGQPANPLTGKMLADYYDLPLKDQVVHKPAAPGQILVGSKISHLTTLPKPNKRDPLVREYFHNYMESPNLQMLTG
jgi:hypothetical protein